MNASPTLPPPPKDASGEAPQRMPGSARRTSSIDVDWPDGGAEPMRLQGRARDIVTPAEGGAPLVMAEGRHMVRMRDRRILSIEAQPPVAGLSALEGERAGNRLRGALERHVPDEWRQATPLHLILDDLAGTSLVGPWAFTQWIEDFQQRFLADREDPKGTFKMPRVGVCIGLRPGSSGHDDFPTAAETGELRNADDPEGWHDWPETQPMSFRRARRLDMRVERGELLIDTMFQDSATTPDGHRAVIHEYHVAAAADAATMRLKAIEAIPRVLPFAECPSAAANVERLVGVPLADMRAEVLEKLPGMLGCTHLNDALRGLADVPPLAACLDAHFA